MKLVKDWQASTVLSCSFSFKWVLALVSETERFQGFYSNLFTVSKAKGYVLLIMDLDALNTFFQVKNVLY